MGRFPEDSDGLRRPPGFAEALGRTIKVIRTDQGIERRDLAKRAGISYSYLTEIENGNKPPSSSVLAPIAEALGLRMSQLIEAAEARMESQGGSRSQGADAWSSQDARVGLMAERAASPVPRFGEERLHGLRFESRAGAFSNEAYTMRPSLRGSRRDVRPAILELERLLRDMAPEDVERLLDFARRLAR
jgi:transcriptional regulator with XRE-family HTH domain